MPVHPSASFCILLHPSASFCIRARPSVQTPTIEASRAYLHHLCRMREPLFHTLASMHNIQYMTTLMRECRQRILADDL